MAMTHAVQTHAEQHRGTDVRTPRNEPQAGEAQQSMLPRTYCTCGYFMSTARNRSKTEPLALFNVPRRGRRSQAARQLCGCKPRPTLPQNACPPITPPPPFSRSVFPLFRAHTRERFIPSLFHRCPCLEPELKTENCDWRAGHGPALVSLAHAGRHTGFRNDASLTDTSVLSIVLANDAKTRKYTTCSCKMYT